MFKKYIGLRTIKTGIAVCLTIFITALLELDSPFFGAIAAIISMDKTIIGSFNTGKNRMIGTLLGAVLGLVCASIQPENALICGIGIIILISICNLMKLQGSITVGGIVLIAIMVNLNGKTPFMYSINRILDTFIGIFIAVMVNLTFFPYDNLEGIKATFKGILRDLEGNMNQYSIKSEICSLAGLKSNIAHLEKELNLYKADIHAKKKVDSIKTLDGNMDRIKSIIMHMELLNHLQANDILANITETERTIVYQYHLRTALSLYEGINKF